MAEAGNQTGQSSAPPAGQSGQAGNTGQSATTSSQQSQQTNGQQTNGAQQQTGQTGAGEQRTGDSAATKAERPADLPESLWLADKRVIDYGKLNEIVTRDAADQVRRNGLPATPEAYRYELPKDFKAPDGVEFKFNENDQNLQQARVAAKEMGLTQDQFSRFLGLYAGDQVNTQQKIKTARETEINKLGPTATARMSAINTFLEGTLGAEAAKPL